MKRKILTLFLVLTLAVSGCSNTKTDSNENDNHSTNDNASENNNTNNDSDNSSGDGTSSTVQVPDTSDLFTDRDYEIGYNESKSALIELNEDSASCTSNAVVISGNTVTITDEGTYILKGSLEDGMIIVNTDKEKKVQLYLDNVSIHSETSAPIYVLQADKVFITLAPDSENTLSNGGSFVAIDDNNIDSTIFSKEDLTMNGSGTLTINSPAGHGIVSKDELTFTSGTYNISSSSHAVTGKDNLCIANAVFNIESGKDGLHAENNDDTSLGFVYIQSGTFDITAEGDGVSASSTLQIDGGTFDIISGGGSENSEKQTSDSWGGFPGNMGGGGMHSGRRSTTSSASESNASYNTGAVSTTSTADDSTSIKGLKSSGNMVITNGTFTIDAADDTIHSNASITINNGTFTLKSGDDGIHADETLDILGGTISISESYEGLEALDIYVRGGDIDLVASDDGLNAAGGTDSSGYGGNRGNDKFGGGMSSSSNGSINIQGGNLYVNASGDGIDANGTLTISGGYTVVCGPTQGDTATLDYDISATITGGTFIGTGASGMAQTFSDSKQGVIAVSVGSQSAGTKIVLEDASGNVILSHSPELNFAVVILSSPDIVKGDTYKITVGKASGEFAAS